MNTHSTPQSVVRTRSCRLADTATNSFPLAVCAAVLFSLLQSSTLLCADDSIQWNFETPLTEQIVGQAKLDSDGLEGPAYPAFDAGNKVLKLTGQGLQS